MDSNKLAKKYQELVDANAVAGQTDNMANSPYMYPVYPEYPTPCPGYGRCPYCGRGGYARPWYDPYIRYTKCALQNA